ncbi:ferredoxin [Parafrankia colletiae]|uniref:Ferredoxin n=1 Tax=Parafrankia colletiae TaxID=573497 RepID=A0A1S1QSP8_9ACTN|nr:ferredoxin [Parafrankia colletiae]MCK9903085.1 ferredoxin [Frankia sp. Cpl3]OHV35414.1 ferredoxin [Parafrankia colletiae]
MGAPSVAVDRERCVGSGMCVLYAPDSFAHDEVAKVVVLDPMGDEEDVIGSAVDACPTGALRLAQEKGT